MAAIVRPRFYSLIAIVLAVLVFIGFARTFYLSFLFDVPPRTLLLTLHGIVFTAWVALFVVQTRLVAANRVRTHMKLGLTGIALAAIVFGVGVVTTIEAIQVARPRPLGLNSAQFSIVPFMSIGLFGAFVAIAVALRRRPAIHKRFMMLAMISAMAPPVARIVILLAAQVHFELIQISMTAALVTACLSFDWIRHRVVHPVYLIGGAVLIASWPLRIWIAQTAAWENFARSLLS